MASNSNKTPPLLSKAETYNDWIKLLYIWTEFNELPEKRQGPAVLLSLEGKAQQAVLEPLWKEEILSETGVAKIRSKLDKIHKKDKITEKYNSLQVFKTYKKRTNETSREYIAEFDKRYQKLKSYGTQMTEDLLGYKLLKSANLSPKDEQIVKATVSELKYEVRTKVWRYQI